ncbi:hypothetical protein DMUE_4124 [Dictyocoela muelleri]|nr:hypothetical protein DMUE_4124 [Dictyocoela muelleri]
MHLLRVIGEIYNHENEFNKNYSRNIFTNFINFGHPRYVEHGILNSSLNGQKISIETAALTNNADTQPIKHIQVDCKIQNTEILIKRDLHLFETLSSEIFQGIQTFKNTLKLTDWSA